MPAGDHRHDASPLPRRLPDRRARVGRRPRSNRVVAAADALQTPEQFLGFKVGTDNKLVRWDKIVEYMKLAAANSDRVRFRELGKTIERQSVHRPRNQLARHAEEPRSATSSWSGSSTSRAARRPTPSATRSSSRASSCCSSRAASTRPRSARRRCRWSSCTGSRPTIRPTVKKILDNVIFVLVPSLNPDGQIMVTDWFNKNVGTPYEPSPIPYLYHPYVGHDNNRDMYMFTQKESQHTARAAVARLVPDGVARRAPDGQQRGAHLRDAGDRSDQRERAPAHLPVERHPRPVAGGGARGRRQGRHHLQLHVHELLGRRDGVERLVAQPDRPAHRGRQRARRRADRSAAAVPGPAPAAGGAGGGRGGFRSFDSEPLAAADRHQPAHRRTRAPGWAATGRSATSSTTS